MGVSSVRFCFRPEVVCYTNRQTWIFLGPSLPAMVVPFLKLLGVDTTQITKVEESSHTLRNVAGRVDGIHICRCLILPGLWLGRYQPSCKWFHLPGG